MTNKERTWFGFFRLVLSIFYLIVALPLVAGVGMFRRFLIGKGYHGYGRKVASFADIILAPTEVLYPEEKLVIES